MTLHDDTWKKDMLFEVLSLPLVGLVIENEFIVQMALPIVFPILDTVVLNNLSASSLVVNQCFPVCFKKSLLHAK